MPQGVSQIVIDRTIFSLFVAFIALAVSIIGKAVIDSIFSSFSNRVNSTLVKSKSKTLTSLLKNILDVILGIMAVLIILAEWQINIMPLLTGAGIVGLAISFGAQTVVKDIISGFFIILEDQFNVGDRIKIDKYEGEVYKVTLRLTVLKDKSGNLIFIPNSQVTNVIRYINQRN